MAGGAAAIIAVQEVVDAPIRLAQLIAHSVDGLVPVLVVVQDGGGQHKGGLGVLRPQAADPFGVLLAPKLGCLALVILLHDVHGVMVVLADGQHHHMGGVAGEVPGLHLTEGRVVAHLVIAGEHTHIVRAVEIASLIQEGNAALGNIVQLRAQLAGGEPGVAPPHVGVFAIVLGVGLAPVFLGLADLACGHAVAIDLHAAGGALGRGQQLAVFSNDQAVEGESVAGILALEDMHRVLAPVEELAQVNDRLAVFRQQGGMELTIHQHAQAALPVVGAVGEAHLQHAAGNADAQPSGHEFKAISGGVFIVDAANVLDHGIAGHDKLLAGIGNNIHGNASVSFICTHDKTRRADCQCREDVL